MKPGRSMGVPVRHTAVTGGEIYYIKYKEEVGVFGEILQVVGANGQLGRCVVSGTGEAERVLQRGQCMGYLFPLLNINYISNKITSTYSVFRTIDISLCLRHLAEPRYSEFYNLLARWSNVFSRNKYNVGITKEEYAIQLINGTPVKSYTPRCSPAVIEAIESELEKLKRADFIEPSNSPYSAPTVCVRKPDGSL